MKKNIAIVSDFKERVWPMRSPCSERPYEQPIDESTAEIVLRTCGFDSEGHDSQKHVLDFGCGNGRYLEVFARKISQSRLVGVETDPESVSKTRRKGFQCLLLQTEDAALPFQDCCFDVVFSSNVIEHIRRPMYLRYLWEIHRVLKQGGRFAVGTPNYPVKRVYDMKKAIKSKYTRYYLFDDPTHCNKLSIFRLERDLRCVFRQVHLDPSYLFFEERIELLRRPQTRRLLRGLGDKVFGYCIKE